MVSKELKNALKRMAESGGTLSVDVRLQFATHTWNSGNLDNPQRHHYDWKMSIFTEAMRERALTIVDGGNDWMECELSDKGRKLVSK